jgi:hypothetical protein
MKKAIALLAGNARLEEINRETQEAQVSIDERKRFLVKQLEDLRQDRVRLTDQVNAQLADYCRGQNLLPADFDPKKHHFHVEAGALILCDEETTGSPGLEIILGQLFPRGPQS